MYEWDEGKRAANLAKHGVDFSEAAGFEWESAEIEPDLRRNYGELRYIATGFIDARLFVLTYTPRAGTTRLISLRKANDREKRRYLSAREA